MVLLDSAASEESFYDLMKESIDRIGLDSYVDVFLIHSAKEGTERRAAAWKARVGCRERANPSRLACPTMP